MIGRRRAIAIYPKPKRLVIFSGTIPHVARPVTRHCALT
jgi:hypothetical protein